MSQGLPSSEMQYSNISLEQMRAAIPILKKRISELRSIDVDTIHERGEIRLDTIEKSIDSTIEDIFGNDTLEYHFHRILLDTASKSLLYPTPLNDIREGYKRGITLAIDNINKIIKLLEERIGDLAFSKSAYGSALRAFHDLDIHPEVLCAVSDLLENGYYSRAVEEACKKLDDLVKTRSGIYDLDGAELMQFVFSETDPILLFDEQVSKAKREKQQGMMFLYSGAMLALRRRKSQEFIEEDPEKALEYIAFISLLAKMLDKAEHVERADH